MLKDRIVGLNLQRKYVFKFENLFVVQNFKIAFNSVGAIISIRGGVEDTRLEAKAKDSLSEDRHSRGQGQKCSRPRPMTKDTSASALQKKRYSQKIFRRSPKKKKVFHKNFSSDLHKKTFSKKFFKRSTKFLTIQKIVLFSSRGQANFRGFEASRPRTWPSRPRPRTSKCVLEAKDVLENSTSDFHSLRMGSLEKDCFISKVFVQPSLRIYAGMKKS